MAVANIHFASVVPHAKCNENEKSSGLVKTYMYRRSTLKSLMTQAWQAYSNDCAPAPSVFFGELVSRHSVIVYMQGFQWFCYYYAAMSISITAAFILMSTLSAVSHITWSQAPDYSGRHLRLAIDAACCLSGHLQVIFQQVTLSRLMLSSSFICSNKQMWERQ